MSKILSFLLMLLIAISCFSVVFGVSSEEFSEVVNIENYLGFFTEENFPEPPKLVLDLEDVWFDKLIEVVERIPSVGYLLSQWILDFTGEYSFIIGITSFIPRFLFYLFELLVLVFDKLLGFGDHIIGGA